VDERTYNGLLDGLTRSSTWKHGDGLCGTSPELLEFVRTAATVGAYLTASNSPDATYVVVYRPAGSERADRGILTLLGMAHGHVVDLKGLAHVFNQRLLFGYGPLEGVVESDHTGPLVIRSADNLQAHAIHRLLRHLRHWRRPGSHTVFFASGKQVLATFVSELSASAEVRELAMPRMASRRVDIPWALHDEASEYGGGLDEFDPSALEVLIRHEWPGDLGELARVVRRLYFARSGEGRRSFNAADVVRALNETQSATAGYIEVDTEREWGRIRELVGECDHRSTRLLGFPFFVVGTLPAQTAPLSPDCPELCLQRLISWAYMLFVEAAEPNLRIILKLASGLRQDLGTVSRTRIAVAALRTLEQHRLDAGSEHDGKTVDAASAWYEGACGRRQAEPEDVEQCIGRLMLDVVAGLEAVVAFLRALAGDEFRDLIVRQWRDLAEKQWPKYRFEALVAEVLSGLGRADLRADVVTERLLGALQQSLAGTSDAVDRESVIRAMVERKISEEFPRDMPVDGRDIIALGIAPSAEVGRILSELRAHFAENNASRAELLLLAKEVIARRRQ
jgi:hypothetical protein